MGMMSEVPASLESTILYQCSCSLHFDLIYGFLLFPFFKENHSESIAGFEQFMSDVKNTLLTLGLKLEVSG